MWAPRHFFAGEMASVWQAWSCILGSAACLLMSVSLDRVDRTNWWAWLLSYVFLIAYFVKSYVVSRNGSRGISDGSAVVQ